MIRKTHSDDTGSENVTAAYVIQAAFKVRIKELADAQDLSESQTMRRILADYFARLDAAPSPILNPGKADPA